MLILIHGKDLYRSLDQIKAIKKQALLKNAEIHSYNLDEVDKLKQLKVLEEIKQSSELGIFNSSKKLIIINNFKSFSKQNLFDIKPFFDIIQRSKEDIFVFFEPEKLISTDKIYKYLVKLESKVYEFDSLTGQKRIAYTNKLAMKYDIILDTKSIIKIQEISNNDNFVINNLLNKIANLYLEKFVTIDMIQKFESRSEEYKIFVFTEYILKKNFRDIFKVIDNFENKREEPLKLLAFLISQIKKALMIKDLQHNGIKDYNNYFEGNTYSVNIMASQVSKWSLLDLKLFYFDLIDLDYKIKFDGNKPYILIKSFFNKYI